jgi:hypothetical protein
VDTAPTTTSTDSLRKRYFTTQHTMHVASGNYTVAAEVVDRVSGSIGAFRTSYESDVLTGGFAMSDLLLARRIEPKKSFPESREDLDIEANPMRTFYPAEPVYIYLELYDLKRDTFGRTRFDIAYRIGRPKNKKIDPALFTDLNLPEGQIEIRLVEQPNKQLVYDVSYTVLERNLINKWKEVRRNHFETTITAQYEGDNRDDFTYLQIDISQLPTGVHQLTVFARDLHTNKKVERHLLFRVI